ncbi:ABC transporter ATP-binding protein [Actinomadura sp. 1N219]|uniref:ABC transporter ATP-binding protein n=1 Tax=Actinomadura sp. 1N219 TaxID=3375152 RepID=UPI0037975CCB
MTALHEADLVIERGELVAIVGPSGSGKSTLLNLLGLLDRPSSGAYRLDGVDVAPLSEAERTALRGQRIGFAFQAFHLLPYRSAVENVMLAQLYAPGRRSGRRSKGQRAGRREAAQAALRRVGLGHRMDALPSRLSGGERQRVAIARALVNEPSLLLCDEPTGNLDSETSATVLELLEALHRSGQTVVVITHDAEVARRAERIVTIRDGRLGEDAAP